MKQEKIPLKREWRAKLLDILAIRHSHSEMTQWALCKECQTKFQEYKLAKSKLTSLQLAELEKEVFKRAEMIKNRISSKIIL